MNNQFAIRAIQAKYPYHGIDDRAAEILLANISDETVLSQLKKGDASTFDLMDRFQFNDSYEDMMDDLGI